MTIRILSLTIVVRKAPNRERAIKKIYADFMADVREYQAQTGADVKEAKDAVRQMRDFFKTIVLP